MAVRAQQGEVLQASLRLSDAERVAVVTLGEVSPALAVRCLEVERADLTLHHPSFSLHRCDLGGSRLGVTLTRDWKRQTARASSGLVPFG